MVLAGLLLEANVLLQGPAGQRALPAAEFLQGYYTTAAAPDEMITEVWFPRPAPRAALTEFAERQGDFAVVAAAVAVDIADGVCRSARVVLGGVGPLPVVVGAEVLAGQPAAPESWHAMGEHAASQIEPPSDTHGSSGFRKRLAATLVSRALAEASRP
jgi:carbon-monoxide dehydrogenase medium subunit